MTARRSDPVRARTRPAGLVILGHPIQHSLSPRMHDAALRAANIPLEYHRRDVTPGELAAVLRELAVAGMAGNVTMPHKDAVHDACHVTSPLAARIGSVNTFWHEDGRLHGHNTDVAGIRATFDVLCPDGLVGRRAAVLGAGGAAAAALVALDLAGCTDIRMVARTEARAARISTRAGVPVHLSHTIANAVDAAAIVINATPLGMHDDALPVEPDQLPRDCAVFDLVYRAGETPWVRASRSHGLRAEDGLRMLVEQGAEAFRVWFDRDPSLEAMWRALEPRDAPRV